MLLFRNVEKSVYDAVAGLFTNPTSGLTARNVYGEDAFFNDDFKPVFPFVYLMGYRVPPRETRLPMVILDMGQKVQSYYEIGNREGTFAGAALHVCARTRGERDDLGAYLYQNLVTIPVNDYSGSTPVFQYHAQVEGKFAMRGSVNEALGIEGALTNWIAVSFAFQLFE